jgi:predicted lipoprotein with Yx(FWY)xxD motif
VTDRSPRRRTALAAAVAATAFLLTGCGGPEPATEEAAFTLSGDSTTVGTGDTVLGRILVGADGRTLYTRDGTSQACTGACAQQWPPYVAEGVPFAADGELNALLVQELGTYTTSDGVEQVTYRGLPLHYYRGDDTAGQVGGQGLEQFGGTWHAVSPTGDAVVGIGRG